MLWVSVDKEVFLLLTKEKTKMWNEYGSTFQYTNPVEVLLLLDDLKLNQEINIKGIHSFESFYLAGKTLIGLLVINCMHDKLGKDEVHSSSFGLIDILKLVK